MIENKSRETEELIKQVEKAAERGAGRGACKGRLVSGAILILIIVFAVLVSASKVNTTISLFKEQIGFDDPASDHDLVLENKKALGYTAADFADAIIGNSARISKLEVFKQEISDLATITETGLFNWGVFTKVQYLTYHGTAIYTVDLSKLSYDDITLDEKDKTVLVCIPHPQQEEINILEKDIEFGDTTKGILAFGDIEMTQEQSAKVQAGARNKMEAKLVECNALKTAERMAILSVWEMYSPLVKSIASDYVLRVEFQK